MPALTPEMIAACGPAAKKYGVSENIHPDDLLFWSTGANIDGYFESGHLAALPRFCEWLLTCHPPHEERHSRRRCYGF